MDIKNNPSQAKMVVSDGVNENKLYVNGKKLQQTHYSFNRIFAEDGETMKF